MEDVERELVQQALERTHGNATRAAKLLGMSRDMMRYRIEKYRLLHGLLMACSIVGGAILSLSAGA
jgi:DNA-binding NtrC family response regulator